MKKLLLICISFLVLQAVYCQPVKGHVSAGNRPLAGASVTSANASTITDPLGDFILLLPDSNSLLYISHAGYTMISMQVNPGDSITATMQLSEILLQPVTVQAFESNVAVEKVAAAVTVLTHTALDRYNNTGFVPALNTVAGVKMDERSPGSYRLSIRGNLLRSTFGVRNVKMYWNGIPFTDANGNTYLNQVAFSNIGSMEIIKGPSGSMYGAGTGGVVLLSGPAMETEGKYLSVQSAAGSYGLYAISGSYKSSAKDHHDAISFSHQQSTGYRDQTAMRRDVANYSATYLLNNRQDISANLFYSDLYYQTPGGLTAAELAADPRQARPAAGIFNSAAAQKAALYLTTLYAGIADNYRISNRWSNTTGIYISNTRFKNPTIRNYERKTEQGAGARSVFRYKHKGLSLTSGGEYQYTFNNTATYGNRLGTTDTLQYHDEISSRQYNIFLQAEAAIHSFFISAGISYNNYHYGLLRVSNPGSAAESSDFTPQFIPRISLMKEISRKIHLFTTVSKGYSPPSIDEVHASDGIFNTALNAETGINYEAGIKSLLLHSRLSIDAGYYLFRLQHTIVSRRDASGADYYVNAGKTRQAGIELTVNYNVLKKEAGFVRDLKAWGSLTYIHARFSEYQQGVNKYDGNMLTGTAPVVAVAGVDMHIAGRFAGNFSYTYTDAIPLNDANSFFAPHYNMLYAKAGYNTDQKKQITAELYVAWERSFNNPFSLGNDLNAAGNRYYNPSAPENFTTGLRLRLRVD